MAIAYVQAATAIGTASNAPTVALTGATAGNLLVLCVVGDGSSVSSVTDSSGNTVNTALTYASGQSDVKLGCYYVINASSGAHTFTVNLAGNTNSSLIVLEYSGADTTSPLDNTPSITTANNTTPVTTPSATPSATGDVALAFGSTSTGLASLSSWTNSFSTRSNVGSVRPLYVGELIVSGTSAQSTTMTWDSSGWLASTLVLFKEASAASGVSKSTKSLLLGVG